MGSSVAREELRAGLTRALSDVPVRSLSLEAGATWSQLYGAGAYAEAVVHPARNVGLFASATWSPDARLAAVAGVRYTYRW